MRVAALDFESFAIAPRPAYPPRPVGIAIYEPPKPAVYMAFGHPTNNNCDKSEARLKTAEILDQADILLFHNAAFDCAILEEVWSMIVPWHKVQCTMVQAFLHNPHGELALKPLAEQLLGAPPTERDAVQDWLVQHGIVRANAKNWGAYIAYAPGDLVGAYAIGDVERTYNLWEYFNANSI